RSAHRETPLPPLLLDPPLPQPGGDERRGKLLDEAEPAEERDDAGDEGPREDADDQHDDEIPAALREKGEFLARPPSRLGVDAVLRSERRVRRIGGTVYRRFRGILRCSYGVSPARRPGSPAYHDGSSATQGACRAAARGRWRSGRRRAQPGGCACSDRAAERATRDSRR